MTDLNTLVPDHECSGDDTCPHPAALIIAAYDSPSGTGVETEVSIHLLSADMIASTLVKIFDGIALDALNPALPEMIRFAYGREMLRAAIESADPPGDISSAINDMMGSGES